MSRNQFYPVVDIPVADLLLDTNNPRIRHGEDQNDCIIRILRDREKFISLMKDIAINGLTPEHIILSKNLEGKWIVRDGNRRITALKLLNQPELRELEPSLSPLIARIAEQHGNFSASITCLACDDEQSILDYLDRKHTGENNGIGQSNWSPLMKALFNLQLELPDQNKRAAQLVLWAESHGLRVEDDFSLTSLTRALNTVNLVKIGFVVQNDTLKPILTDPQCYALAARVITDISQGKVHVKRDDSEGSIYSPEQQLAYFNRVRAEIGPQQTTSSSATDAQPGEPGQSSTPPTNNEHNGQPHGDTGAEPITNDLPEPTAPRRPPSPTTPSWERPGLFIRRHPGFSVPSTNTKVCNIIAELKKLNVKETPQAVAMLFRTLIELSEKHYRETKEIADTQYFVKNISKAADHMKENGRLTHDQHEVIITRTRDDAGMLSAKSLQKYIHSTEFHPNYQTINSLWDEIGSFVGACWSV